MSIDIWTAFMLGVLVVLMVVGSVIAFTVRRWRTYVEWMRRGLRVWMSRLSYLTIAATFTTMDRGARELTNHLAQLLSGMEAVHETAIALNAAGDIQELLRRTLQGFARITSPEAARILVLDKEFESFVLRAEMDGTGNVSIGAIHASPCIVTREILRGRRARFVEDVQAEGAPLSSSMAGTVQAYVGMPLLAVDKVFGILYFTYNSPHRFSRETRQLIQTMAAHATVAISNAKLLEEARATAVTDVLTGLPNHRHLMDRLDQEMERSRRSGHPLAVMMMDLDDFKLVNDTHGHTVGDRLLREVASAVQSALRATDIVGRYGGDEFLALLPETDRTSAEVVAKRIIEQVESLQFTIEPEETGSGRRTTIPVHVSIGSAIYPQDSAVRLELISLADTAMYSSKRSGGNSSTSAQVTNSAFLAAQNTTFGVLEGLLNSVDAKDHYTRLHSEQVAQCCLAAADVMGLSPEVKRRLRIASLLHDVGKIGIPDRILRKPGPLSGDEFEVVRQHTVLGEMIIREVPQLTDVLDAVRHHHERYDGNGYPRGMAGEEIPFLARIIAIADAYSAMTLDRPYRSAMSREEAMSELRKGAGKQFDPVLVESFIGGLEANTSAPGPQPVSRASALTAASPV